MGFSDKVRRIVDRAPLPGRWKFWLLCALMIKCFYFGISLHQNYQGYIEGTFAVCTGDCPSYLDPIDHLVTSGSYDPDFRMPGYGAIYLPLRFLFAKRIATDLLVLLQVLLDALATYLLAKGIWRLTGSRRAFLIGFFLYGFGCAISGSNIFILTESLCASALAFAFYFTTSYLRKTSSAALFMASTMITWAYFMRPIMVVLTLLLLVFLAVVVLRRKQHRSRMLTMLVLPILLIQLPWTIRNYHRYGEVFLLTRTTYYPAYSKAQLATWKFVGTFDDAPKLYFFPDLQWTDRQTDMVDVRSIPFPARIFTKDFNADSLEVLRTYCALLQARSTPATEKAYYDSLITARVDGYTASIKANKKFMTYVETPLKRACKHLFTSSGAYKLFHDPFSQLNMSSKLIKLFGTAVYLLALYGSLLFAFWSLRHFKRGWWFLTLFLGYGLLVHPVILGFQDTRYLYAFFPVMCICATLGIIAISSGLKPLEKLREEPA